MSHSFDTTDYDPAGSANDQVDLYDRATAPTAKDDILGETNLGLGNYTEKEYWMQVDAFRKWVFAHSAVSKPMNRRVVDFALTQAAVEAWNDLDPEERDEEWADIRPDEGTRMDRRRWIQQKKADLWDVPVDDTVTDPGEAQEIRDEERQMLIEEYGRGDLHWQPPFGRMLKMRHEASRSVGSRLLDNLFGRVSVEKLEQSAREAASGLRERFGAGGDTEDREP